MEPESSTTSLSCTLNNEFQNIEMMKEQDMILSVNLKAPFFEDEDRAPIDLIAVVDVSGSMRHHIELVRKTLKFMVRQLGPKDSFCMVAFSSTVSTTLNWTKMDGNGKEEAVSGINGLNAQGGTFLSGGLLTGVRKARNRPVETANEICSVLLFTDGAATTGITSAEEMKTAISNLQYDPLLDASSDRITVPRRKVNKRISDPVKEDVPEKTAVPDEESDLRDVPFTIYSFGYGMSHQADLLREIADCRDGVYYFIEHEDSIADSFTDCLGGLLSIVGQNINISIRSMEDVKIEEVMASYRLTTNEENRDYTIHLGDIQSEEQKDLLIRVKLPPFRSEGSFELLQWKVEYFNVLTCEQEEISLISSINAMETVEDPVINYHILQQKLRVLVSSTLKSVQNLRDSPEQCKTTLDECLQKLVSSPIAQDEFVTCLIEDVNEVQVEIQTSRDSYQLANKMGMHSRQRNAQGSQSRARYTTNKKSAMKSKYTN